MAFSPLMFLVKQCAQCLRILSGFIYFIDIDAGVNTHSVKHLNKKLGSTVALGSRGVGASAESADSRVKHPDTGIV
jgi:hypothetical protein